MCCRKVSKRKWINTHHILVDYLSKCDSKWNEFFYFYYNSTDLDSIKSKLQLCPPCASYFRQGYHFKNSEDQFINLFEETDNVLVKPLALFMIREGMLAYFYLIKKSQIFKRFSGQKILLDEEGYSQSQSQRSIQQECNNIPGFDGVNEDDIYGNPPSPPPDVPAADEQDHEIENLENRFR